MGHPFRVARPWQPVEVTARTIQGRFLLAPSERLNALIAGILAIGRERYQVRIHNMVFLSNHFHMLVSAANSGELSRFMNFVMGNIAKEAGRLHDWSGPFWGDRYRPIPIEDQASLLDRMRYVFANGCKEGLVGHPGRWPGLNAVAALTEGQAIEGIWVDRTALYFASRRKDTQVTEADFTTPHRLVLDPLPGWEDLPAVARQARTREMVDGVAAEYAGLGTGETARLAKLDPQHRPAHLKRGRAPLCHASTRAARLAFREMYHAFVAAYRSASDHLRDNLAGHGYPTHSQVMAYMVEG